MNLQIPGMSGLDNFSHGILQKALLSAKLSLIFTVRSTVVYGILKSLV